MVVTGRVSPPPKPKGMVPIKERESQCRVSPPQRPGVVGPHTRRLRVVTTSRVSPPLKSMVVEMVVTSRVSPPLKPGEMVPIITKG